MAAEPTAGADRVRRTGFARFNVVAGSPGSLAIPFGVWSESMGRGFTEYLLPQTGWRDGVAFSAFIDYRLPDGTKLHILQQEAWCRTCRRFVAAEDIPLLESLEEEIRRLLAGDPELLRRWEFVSNGAPV
jgi:hypothetical protein